MVYDVVIAGAGPVGLFLACELRRTRLSVLVLERLEDPRSPLKRLPFGMRGLWGPSIEAFYRRGLLEAIAAQPRANGGPGQPSPSGPIAPGAKRSGPAGHFAGLQFDHANVDSSRWTYRLSGPSDLQLGAEMEHLERVLAAHALSMGAELQRGLGVDGVAPSDDEVTVRSGEQRFHARYLVGCDGGRSTVRKQAGFEFVGTLLAGDAAHIHSPLGGQGLNLGLGDAMNLGWKLAATVRGIAPAGLLDSYTAERHPIGARILDWTRAQVALMRPGARALQSVVRDLIGTRDGATYFAERVWGVNLRYDLGGAHPLAGRSCPDFELENGARVGALLRDGRGLLLDFTKSLRSLDGRWGDQVRYVASDAKERLGLTALLVRPDGFVAWASDAAPDADEVTRDAVSWFMSLERHTIGG
jgi:2-polyprenyl-6-methoxyphenol hydroxylase-like FAD-dependent oxidoreductase